MRGSHILARTLGDAGSVATIKPDRRAKLACWAVLFDMLSCSDALFHDAAAGLLRLRLDEPFTGPAPDTIDMAVTRAACTSPPAERQRSFATLAQEWDVALDADDSALFARLPSIVIEPPASAPAAIAVALTAADCVASRADLTQLHARTLVRGWFLKRHARYCVSAALTPIVDDDETATERIIDVLADVVPRSVDARDTGHDAVAATIIGASSAQLRRTLEASYLHHAQAVSWLCSAYHARNRSGSMATYTRTSDVT
jgi:hypothetical protein